MMAIVVATLVLLEFLAKKSGQRHSNFPAMYTVLFFLWFTWLGWLM